MRFGQNKDSDRYRELEFKIRNMEQQLQEKEFDMNKIQNELNEKESDIKTLAETFECEYEALRLENEKNVVELQKAYKENI